MSFDKYRPAFDREGFVIVRQMLPSGEFAELKANLERYIRDIVPSLPDAHAFYEDKGDPATLKQLQFLSRNDAYFLGYRRHPTWTALAQALLGEPADAEEPEWFCKPPGNKLPTPPHQDNYYFNLKPPSVLTIWMALETVDEENGCLRYVQGSHRRGIRPHSASKIIGFSQGITDYGPEDTDREVPILLEPGDVVAHHGNTIHRADANRSRTRSRRAFAQVFKGASCRRDEQGFARYTANLKKQHEELGLKT